MPDNVPEENDSKESDDYRIVVLGANPVGFEATLYGRYLGHVVELVDVRDLGSELASVEDVMGRRFCECCTSLGLAALDAQNSEYRSPPAETILTFGQWAAQYCVPLAKTDLVAGAMRLGFDARQIEFVEENETYRIEGVDSDGAKARIVCDFVVDTRNALPLPGTESSEFIARNTEFVARNTDDYFEIISAATGFDFLAATDAIRKAYAVIGEREELDLYETMKTFQL